MIINGSMLLKLSPIEDMLDHKVRQNGVSHGLSEAGYDIRLKQTVMFIPAGCGAYIPSTQSVDGKVGFNRIIPQEDTVYTHDAETGDITSSIGSFCLASTQERFIMPRRLVGEVKDKSTWAREGLSVFNTVIEPGWCGWLTLELKFQKTDKPLTIKAGSGIAQVLFYETSMPTAYEGKYQNAEDKPQTAIREL